MSEIAVFTALLIGPAEFGFFVRTSSKACSHLIVTWESSSIAKMAARSHLITGISCSSRFFLEYSAPAAFPASSTSVSSVSRVLHHHSSLDVSPSSSLKSAMCASARYSGGDAAASTGRLTRAAAKSSREMGSRLRGREKVPDKI